MTTEQRWRFYELTRKLTPDVLDIEWEYFQKWARKFPTNLEGRRYGILKIGTEPKDDNFVFDNDIAELRIKHVEHISENGMNEGHKARIFLDWLEQSEGR